MRPIQPNILPHLLTHTHTYMLKPTITSLMSKDTLTYVHIVSDALGVPNEYLDISFTAFVIFSGDGGVCKWMQMHPRWRQTTVHFKQTRSHLSTAKKNRSCYSFRFSGWPIQTKLRFYTSLHNSFSNHIFGCLSHFDIGCLFSNCWCQWLQDDFWLKFVVNSCLFFVCRLMIRWMLLRTHNTSTNTFAFANDSHEISTSRPASARNSQFKYNQIHSRMHRCLLDRLSSSMVTSLGSKSLPSLFSA